jgi:sterol desaturase/sphingolipid hydroxylase (fatty acid hydroxylase superfamily)
MIAARGEPVKDLETTAYYGLGIPVIALVFGLEVLLARRRGREIFGFAETISNLSAGLGTLVIGIYSGPLVLALYDGTYARFALLHWGDSLLRWPFALLVSDLCYYLWHRAGHTFGLLWAIHGVHHQHEHLNSTVGLRLEWTADLATVAFFAPMPLLGVDSTTGFLTIALLSLYTLTTHSPVLARPTLGIFVTPATHGSHHSRDARFQGRNFGAMFLFWDRLFRTNLVPEGGLDSLRADLPTVCRFHDGVRSQWSLLVELARRCVRAPFEAPRLLLGPPLLDTGAAPVPRDDREISRGLRLYVLIDFVAVIALGTWLLWFRDACSTPVKVAGAVSVIWGLRTIGGLLDGRRGAVREEGLRLVALLALAVWVASR